MTAIQNHLRTSSDLDGEEFFEEEWLETYLDLEQYVGNCRSDEDLWRLAKAMADDSRKTY